MKKNILRHKVIIVAFIFSFSLIASLDVACANDTKTIYKIKPEDLIASIQANDLRAFDQVADNFQTEHNQLCGRLLEIFNNPKSSNFNRCAAAYYLGEIHVSDAADSLANQISLRLELHEDITALPVMGGLPAMDALIKIGNPSIPAVIRNLAESDDPKVRDLSLQVLYRIDGDKDIVQLRLQKALKAETDSQKQAKLQSALQTLLDPKFTK